MQRNQPGIKCFYPEVQNMSYFKMADELLKKSCELIFHFHSSFLTNA